MKCFIDTANLDEIREATAYGLPDGVTETTVSIPSCSSRARATRFT